MENVFEWLMSLAGVLSILALCTSTLIIYHAVNKYKSDKELEEVDNFLLEDLKDYDPKDIFLDYGPKTPETISPLSGLRPTTLPKKKKQVKAKNSNKKKSKKKK